MGHIVVTGATGGIGRAVCARVEVDGPVVTGIDRDGTVEDLSATVSFLMSGEADFYTGQIFTPNGGTGCRDWSETWRVNCNPWRKHCEFSRR